MIDYLFRFSSKTAAIAALPAYGKEVVAEFPEEKSCHSWGGGVLVHERIETQQGLEAGYWLTIARPQIDEALWALPQCMIEADRERGRAGPQDNALRTRFEEGRFTGALIVPVFA